MSYSIDPAKSFTEEFRTVGSAELTAAITLLSEQPDGLHGAVHDARKRFKRLRGLYRFARADAKDFARRENARIRDMAATLSVERDASALIECVDYLRSLGPDGPTDMALFALERALTARRRTVAEANGRLESKVEAAIATCRAALAALEAQEFPHGRKAAANRVSRGWHDMLAKAQVALMSARAGAEEEDFHELRKRSQDCWMFASLTLDAWPTAFEVRRERAKMLADLLGHEHDLSVLITLIEKPAGLALSTGNLDLVLAAATCERERLRRASIRLARRVYADDPDHEAAVVRRLWRG